MIDLNAYAKEIHENAVKHGWWEKPREFGEIIALIHSELSEALEEYRKYGEAPENMVYYLCNRQDCYFYGAQCTGSKCIDGKRRKPGGIAVELIDAVIRILDYCRNANLPMNTVTKPTYKFTYDNFGIFIAQLHILISSVFDMSTAYVGIGFSAVASVMFEDVILGIFHYLRTHNIDPEDVMREKMAYNVTRPYRHGGKKL